MEKAYTHHAEVRENWQQLKKCTDSLKRKVKELNH